MLSHSTAPCSTWRRHSVPQQQVLSIHSWGRLVFTINGLSFVAVITALLFMRLRPVPLCPRDQSPMAGIVEGLKYVWKHQNIRALIMLIGVTSLLGLSFVALIPAWAIKVLHGTSTTGATINGLLQSARGVGALMAALTIATVSHLKVKGRVATFGTFAYPIALLAFAAVRSTPVAMLLMALIGFSGILVINLCNVLIQSRWKTRCAAASAPSTASCSLA